ncbi:MAG: hypothetical protein ACOY3P_17980 [Planctomycetota bacterium]
MELPASYLTELTTIDRAVAENLHEGRPFGHAEDDWKRLLANWRQGDELWNFAPPSLDVIQVWGVALVRDGRVVSTVVAAVD